MLKSIEHIHPKLFTGSVRPRWPSVVKRPPVGVAWKFEEGVPAQVSSSSSDRGSKLRGPSQNSPRVASKRDVNITKLKDRIGLCSHDRYVCGAKSDPNHYATVCPVTKPFHFTNPSAKNLSTWCENIVQDRRSLARLMNIMKILHERRHDITMD
ncbi:hypothetical protein AVEN_208981-1 [Araneus ventricosus]|uniref:Uncharacterized protein n=1 Tax=Araneus ventricosus TaxID=182803 RepID=A0A4Y2CQW1_ARAVE|nr:hypothetical protein AVEN_208981-1 [Araneus ventricosus]